MYVQALEKENIFLREEIERSKFYKDKEDYGRFVGGLTSLKRRSNNNSSSNLHQPSIIQEAVGKLQGSCLKQEVEKQKDRLSEISLSQPSFKSPLKEMRN